MPNFNKVFLMGNLTKDPELRYTANGAPVANLRMAINRVYQLQSGEKKEDVCFVTVVVWRKQAEAAGEHLKKGDPIFVEGRLQSKTWETEDKQKRTSMEVVDTGGTGGQENGRRFRNCLKQRPSRFPS